MYEYLAGVPAQRPAPVTQALKPAPVVLSVNLDVPVHPYGPAPRDSGGRIDDYQRRILAANTWGAEVPIQGTCISACTLFLGAQRACVYRTAVLWFHSAHMDGKRHLSGNEALMNAYPEPVRRWARDVGATDDIYFTRRRTLTGEQLIAMGVAECK